MASAAYKYVPQTAATTFVFSFVCFFLQPAWAHHRLTGVLLGGSAPRSAGSTTPTPGAA